jgi:hypothetical protein
MAKGLEYLMNTLNATDTMAMKSMFITLRKAMFRGRKHRG